VPPIFGERSSAYHYLAAICRPPCAKIELFRAKNTPHWIQDHGEHHRSDNKHENAPFGRALRSFVVIRLRWSSPLLRAVAGHGKKQTVRRLHERHKPKLGIERHRGIVDGIDERVTGTSGYRGSRFCWARGRSMSGTARSAPATGRSSSCSRRGTGRPRRPRAARPPPAPPRRPRSA